MAGELTGPRPPPPALPPPSNVHSVSYCTLQRADVKALADMLATTTIIEELEYVRWPGPWSTAGAPSNVSNISHRARCSLTGCGLNAEDARVLAGGLAQNKSLQTLKCVINPNFLASCAVVAHLPRTPPCHTACTRTTSATTV